MVLVKTKLCTFLGLVLFLLTTAMAFGQANVSIEVNWPNWSSENRVTLYDSSNTQLGTICNPAACYNGSGDSPYSTTASFNVPYGTGYYIYLEDSYGDGWNGTGSYVRVSIDGVLTLENDGKEVTVNFNSFQLPRTLTFDITTNPTVFNPNLSVYQEFAGYMDYTSAGGTLRTQSNTSNACSITTSSSGTLTTSIPTGATVEHAYLYWASSGIDVDYDVTLDGQPVTAEVTYRSYSTFNEGYFAGGVADVTSIIQASPDETYNFTDLTIDTSTQYCTVGTVLGGWSVIVFYEEATLPASNIVLYNGFVGQSTAGTDFTLSGFFANGISGSKTTFLTWEGDANILGSSGGFNEQLQFNGNVLSGDGSNTGNNAYNSTNYDEFATAPNGAETFYGLDLDTFDASPYISMGDTSATARVEVGQEYVISNAVIIKVPSNLISGYVFEDIDYGGGAGRNRITSSGAPLEGVVVELYDSSGTLLQTETTDATGEYLFGGMINGTFSVRVVNSSIESTRTGGAGCTNCIPVQTFKTDFALSTISEIVNEVGGADPGGQDVAAGTLAGAQSIASVTINNEGAVGIDFGYNFDTVVNANNSGQGSLHQFIVNSNALGGEATLAQVGLTPARETSIFEIPGLGPHTITLSSYPPIVTGIATWLDATTQNGASCDPRDLMVVLDGNNIIGTGIRLNNTQQGIRGFSFRGFTSRAIYAQSGSIGAQILCNHVGVDPTGSAATPNDSEGVDVNAIGIAIGDGTFAGSNVISGNGYDGIALADFTGDSGFPIKIRGNYIGVAIDGLTPIPNGTLGAAAYNGAGIEVIRVPNVNLEIGGLNPGDANIISGNLESGIVVEQGSTHVSILGNNIGVGIDGSTLLGNSQHGLNIINGSDVIVGDGSAEGRNIISSNGDRGITVVNMTGISILNNYIGVIADGSTFGANGAAGIYAGGSSNITIGGAQDIGNIIAGNIGTGIRVAGTSSGLISYNQINENGVDGITVENTATQVTISRNEIYANGELGIDLNSDNITLNDNGDLDSGPNEFLNFPVISAAYLSGSNLVIKGWASPGATIEVFLTDVNQGTASEGDNAFGLSKDYGEGQLYVGTAIEGSASDLDASVSSYSDVDGNTDTTNRFELSFALPPVIVIGNRVTATATLSNSTSEFSPTAIVSVKTVITNRRITYRVNKN